jgi:glycosyltransferase involved in cell wall biosynthesis
MKILFVTRGFPSEDDIMSGNYESVQAKALTTKGCQVSVICIKLRSFRHFFSRSRITHRIVEGIDIYECTKTCFSTRLKSFPDLDNRVRMKAYRKAFQKCVSEKGMPDIVHAHIVGCAACASFVKDDYHLPLVITEHWTATNVAEVPEWLKKLSFVYYKADRVICVSQILADSLYRNFHVKSMVINNMVNDLFFKSSKIERNDDSFRFIAIGAFRKNKGFDILVDAFAQGHFSSNVSLDIVGDGEERELVENKIREYGISSQVRLLGVKTPMEVNELLCQSDCFVLSSRLETFAIVVIEAMAKGLPVIATMSGGPESFLRPDHGILVEKENPTKLAESMIYMMKHYDDYDSKQIRQYCYDHFSQDTIANQIIKVYKQVIN